MIRSHSLCMSPMLLKKRNDKLQTKINSCHQNLMLHLQRIFVFTLLRFLKLNWRLGPMSLNWENFFARQKMLSIFIQFQHNTEMELTKSFSFVILLDGKKTEHCAINFTSPEYCTNGKNKSVKLVCWKQFIFSFKRCTYCARIFNRSFICCVRKYRALISSRLHLTQRTHRMCDNMCT